MNTALYAFDPRVNAHGFLDDALREFVGYMHVKGEVAVPPAIAFERLGERADLVLQDLPPAWQFRQYRRLAKALSRTARLQEAGRKPNRLQLSARVSAHLRNKRKIEKQLYR